MFTMYFGVIKGECEKELVKLAETTPSLKPYSIRPGYVDPFSDPEVLAAVAGRKTILLQRFADATSPFWRTCTPNLVSPTKEIGIVATILAMGDGKQIKDPDVEDGRIVNNRALRRMAKENSGS